MDNQETDMGWLGPYLRQMFGAESRTPDPELAIALRKIEAVAGRVEERTARLQMHSQSLAGAVEAISGRI